MDGKDGGGEEMCTAQAGTDCGALMATGGSSVDAC